MGYSRRFPVAVLCHVGASNAAPLARQCNRQPRVLYFGLPMPYRLELMPHSALLFVEIEATERVKCHWLSRLR
jgi:hypothetical protein